MTEIEEKIKTITEDAWRAAAEECRFTSPGNITERFLYLELYSIYKLYITRAISKKQAEKLKGEAISDYKVFKLHDMMYAEKIGSIPRHTICPKCGNIAFNYI